MEHCCGDDTGPEHGYAHGRGDRARTGERRLVAYRTWAQALHTARNGSRARLMEAQGGGGGGGMPKGLFRYNSEICTPPAKINFHLSIQI